MALTLGRQGQRLRRIFGVERTILTHSSGSKKLNGIIGRILADKTKNGGNRLHHDEYRLWKGSDIILLPAFSTFFWLERGVN